MINDLSIKTLVGSRLKKARDVKGLSIREASERIGKTYQWLSAIENGVNYCNIDDLYRLSTLYSVQVGQILDRFPLTTGAENIEQKLKGFTAEITSYLPASLPVYSHYDFLNPESKGEPIDWIYWSQQRLAGRNIIIIQAQTHNLEPEILPNDRLVIEMGLAATTGIGAFFIDDIRLDFNSTYGVRLLHYVRKEDFIEVTQPNGYVKEYALESFQGQCIQIIRNMYAENSALGAYRSLDIQAKRDVLTTDP